MLFTSLSPLLLGTFALAASATEAKSIGSNGCAKPFDFPAQPGGPSKGIQIGERKNRITLPKNYKQNVPAPLIFAFHDRNMTADDMEQATSLSADKLNPDAIVVYAAAVDVYFTLLHDLLARLYRTHVDTSFNVGQMGFRRRIRGLSQ